MPPLPSSVRELDDDSIALLLQAYADQMVANRRSLCAAPLEGLCAALYGPGRCGGDADAGAGGNADAEQRLWKYACEKMGLAVLPVYPGGPAVPTWRHAFLALCNEVATLEPEELEVYKGLLRGDDAYDDGPFSEDDDSEDDDSEDDDPDEDDPEAPPQRRLLVNVMRLWNHAAFGGLLCMVHYLLRRVDGIVHADTGNFVALSEASANGHLAVVELLLAHGANVHAQNSGFDDAALREASANGHLAVVEVLLAHGANVHAANDHALRFASTNGHAAVVEVLLAHGANVHARNDAALQEASYYGHLAVVEVLLAHGADVHARSDWALQLASGNGHPAVVEVLLAHGADVHADGDWALQVASGRGHLAVVEVLLAHGADVHADDDRALRKASRKGHLAVVKVLVAHGADVHARDEDGQTALDSANPWHIDIVEALARAGATE